MANLDCIDEFVVAEGHALAEEHAAVMEFIKEAEGTRANYYQEVEPKSVPSGERLLKAKPHLARCLVMAAVEQARHWDDMTERIRNQAQNESERINVQKLPGWETVVGRHNAATSIIKALTRRKLPFDANDLQEILRWCAADASLSSYHFPIGNIARALERYAQANPLEGEFADGIRAFAGQLRSAYDKDVKRYATVVEQLVSGDPEEEESPEEPAAKMPAPVPAMAGSPAVLIPLKQYVGILSKVDGVSSSPVGPDSYPLHEDSPISAEHHLLSQVLEELVGTGAYHTPDLGKLKYGRQLANPSDESAAAVFLAAAERRTQALLGVEADYEDHQAWQSRHAACAVVGRVRTVSVPWSRSEAFDALLYLSTMPYGSRQVCEKAVLELIETAERYAGQETLTEGERYVLSLFRVSLIVGPPLGTVSEEVRRLTRLIADRAAFYLAPGEVWTDLVNSDYASWARDERKNWSNLFAHLLTANSSRPSKKWLKTATEAVTSIGEAAVLESLKRWMPLVARGRSVRQLGHYSGDTRGSADTMPDENATVLRGLLWIIPTLVDRDRLGRLIAEVTLSAYKKVPGVGPRAVKVGNAGVYALSELASIDAVGQLAVLKVRVKFGTAQKEIEKAFAKAAEALGLARDEIEEMGVPSYGLTEVGTLVEAVGKYEADLSVSGTDAALGWRDPKGKRLKSVPAKVRSEHAEELKDLRQSLKDIKSLLPAQRDRIDSMFLAERSWPFAKWKERYLNHPLVGTITRRLIWCVDGTPTSFVGGEPEGVAGEPIEHGETADITLWHPVGRPVEETVAWRERLEALGVTQPFKQAYREVYLLTAAEENTGSYSNRFAAHVIRQHQFNALCSARGWKNQLRLMVDDCYAPPTKKLPQWNLRAEFWVEGIGENYGTDTNEAGSYLYLATDQVRFYRLDAAENWAHAGGGGYTTEAAGPGQENLNEPLPLEEVPPLVFSEVMRDVDLFVGVASVGNDPNWQDGGPEGRYQEYWTSYSFGELSETAGTRKAVLERLVPRLKIADRCSFSDRFLVVVGDRRTYKIHLGSGNILMEPNDEYLCIVPDSRPKPGQSDVYLPFEGDRTLSIILSKALLLAADNKIKDPTILQQIKR